MYNVPNWYYWYFCAICWPQLTDVVNTAVPSIEKKTCINGHGLSVAFTYNMGCNYLPMPFTSWLIKPRGVVIACVCPSVHPSVCSSVHLSDHELYLVHTITPLRFELEPPNLHQICIMGYLQLILKMVVIDPHPQGHFGHFDSECYATTWKNTQTNTHFAVWSSTSSQWVNCHHFENTSMQIEHKFLVYKIYTWHYCALFSVV